MWSSGNEVPDQWGEAGVNELNGYKKYFIEKTQHVQ
jgi:hypothetical protein